MNSAIRIGTAGMLAALAGLALGQVQHGLVNVVENDGLNNPSSVTLTGVVNFGSWDVDGTTSNRGDYTLIGFDAGDDISAGVLMVSAAQNGRSEPSIVEDPYFVTVSSARGGSGDYFIPVHQSPTGSEANFNISLAYFPIADWLAVAAYNSSNGGNFDSIVANPSITLQNEFDFTGLTNEFIQLGGGLVQISLPGLDLARDGVALATGAKNEDNFSQISADGTSLVALSGLARESVAFIQNKDNGDNAGGSEQDPTAFVFVPEGTPNVVMGRFTSSSRILFAQGEFTVDRVDVGTYRLTIAGQTPSTGTLIVSPTFGDNFNVDNVVNFEGDGDSWLIETRDIAGMGLQDMAAEDVVAHFAFFPAGVAINPGTPSRDYADQLDKIVAAQFEVTEFNGGNNLGDMRVTAQVGSANLAVAGDNRGDIHIAWLGRRLLDADGFIIGTPTEFLRDNSGTGGTSSFASTAQDNGFTRTFGVGTSIDEAEMNVNFALVFIPADAGIDFATDAGAAGGLLEVSITDIPSSDGVLVATNWDNNNRVVTVNADDANGLYVTQSYDASGANVGNPAIDSVETGWAFFPYSTPDLVAGQIDPSGAVISSSGTFSVTQGVDGELGVDVWVLDIPGVDSRADGVLLLNAAGADPLAISYESDDQGRFEILALDVSDDSPVLPAFSFVYVPNEGLVAGGDLCFFEVGCPADVDGDGDADADDFFGYLDLFSASDVCADLDLDGDTDADDFFAFLDQFSLGC